MVGITLSTTYSVPTEAIVNPKAYRVRMTQTVVWDIQRARHEHDDPDGDKRFGTHDGHRDGLSWRCARLRRLRSASRPSFAWLTVILQSISWRTPLSEGSRSLHPQRGRLSGMSQRNRAGMVSITTQSSNLWRQLTRRRPASSQTEKSSLLSPNVAIAQKSCSSQVSPVKDSAESTTHLPWRSVTWTSARSCTPMSCRQVARPRSKGWLSAWRMNRRRCLHPRWDQGGCSTREYLFVVFFFPLTLRFADFVRQCRDVKRHEHFLKDCELPDGSSSLFLFFFADLLYLAFLLTVTRRVTAVLEDRVSRNYSRFSASRLHTETYVQPPHQRGHSNVMTSDEKACTVHSPKQHVCNTLCGRLVRRLTCQLKHLSVCVRARTATFGLGRGDDILVAGSGKDLDWLTKKLHNDLEFV